MIKQTITFEDFDGNEVTKDFYFHLSKAKLIAMETGTPDGGMAAKLQQISVSKDGAQIIKVFTEIIGAAVGQRVEGDATKFIQSDEISEEFLNGPAFDAFLMDLVTDTSTAVNFINGVIPKDLAADPAVVAAIAEREVNDIPLPVLEPPDVVTPSSVVIRSGLANPYDSEGNILPWAYRDPSTRELTNMNAEQLRQVYKRKNDGWNPPGE